MPFKAFGFDVAVHVDDSDSDFEVMELIIQDPCENTREVKSRIKSKESKDYTEFLDKSSAAFRKELEKIIYMKENFYS